MKTTIRMALLAFAAIVAISGLAGASASAALPEFSPHEKVSFQVSGTTQGIFHISNGENFDYKTVSGFGTITGASEVKMTLTFHETSGFLVYCFGSEVTTASLSGHLGYINKTTKEVGLLLEAPTPPILKCTGPMGTLEVLGSWIGHVEPVNTKVASLKLTYLASGSTQKPEKFEGELLTNHHLTERYSGGAANSMAQEGALKLESFKVGGEAITMTVLG